MDREGEEGHFLISQLRFDVETRIKSLLLGRVPPSLSFLAHDASWMRALWAAGHRQSIP